MHDDLNLGSYFKAGYPILFIQTHEDARAEIEILMAIKSIKTKDYSPKLSIWSVTDGLCEISDPGKPAKASDAAKEPIKALEQIRKDVNTGHIYAFRNLHLFMSNPLVIQHLKDISREFKQSQKTLIILSAINKIPPELQKDVVLVEYALPNYDQVSGIFDRLWSVYGKPAAAKGVVVDVDEREKIIQSSLGLTTNEAENALAKGIIDAVSGPNKVISALVLKEKALAVKKSGVLEYYESNISESDIGGLGNLKSWLSKRRMAFTKKAKEFGLPKPKGILLVGTPGTGKSLIAKAAASVLGVPLIKFDISRVFGGIVGASEMAMREALQTIDAIGNCVCFVDEADKGFAGASGSGNTDSGVTRRVFGTFLTWMQEKSTPSFIIMTMNSLNGIPPEMLRKGRFDENFFVGLPTAAERKEILNIHVVKRGRQSKVVFKGSQLDDCAEVSNQFSGAELEYGVTEGMYSAFAADRDLEGKDILDALTRITPLAKASTVELDQMVQWAKLNARPAGIEAEFEGPNGRKLTI